MTQFKISESVAKRTSFLLLALTLTVSCGKSGGGSSTSSPSEETIKTESTDAVTGTVGTQTNQLTGSVTSTSSLPAQALSFKTNVTLMNFSATQTAKYNKAISIVKKVIATEAFRTRVLNYTWNGYRQFANNKGLSNAQIYQSILDAAETLKPIKNNTMDIGVKMYYENSSVIGYTNGSISYINVNTKFFDSFNASQVAGNLMHEWLHKIGYEHDFAATAKRPYSVPYAIGYIVRDLGASFL